MTVRQPLRFSWISLSRWPVQRVRMNGHAPRRVARHFPGPGADELPSLRGARIGLLEARYGSDLVALVRRHGGAPVWAPALRESKVACDRQVSGLIDRLARGECPILVLQTGAGANVLFDEARRLGRLNELVDLLGRTTIVARGPKPCAALGQRGLRATVTAREPYTTAELLAAMAPLELGGTCVGIVHYGEPNDPLTEALRHRNAKLEELHVYQWQMPENVEPLRRMVREIVAGRLQAIAFTSQIQARHLFQVAREIGQAEPLARLLNSTTVVASVGPTCSAMLRSLGIPPRVEPERPKMRPLVTALAQYLDRKRAGQS